MWFEEQPNKYVRHSQTHIRLLLNLAYSASNGKIRPKQNIPPWVVYRNLDYGMSYGPRDVLF